MPFTEVFYGEGKVPCILLGTGDVGLKANYCNNAIYFFPLPAPHPIGEISEPVPVKVLGKPLVLAFSKKESIDVVIKALEKLRDNFEIEEESEG